MDWLFLVLVAWVAWTVYYTYNHHKDLLMGDLTLKKELIVFGNIGIAIVLALTLLLLRLLR